MGQYHKRRSREIHFIPVPQRGADSGLFFYVKIFFERKPLAQIGDRQGIELIRDARVFVARNGVGKRQGGSGSAVTENIFSGVDQFVVFKDEAGFDAQTLAVYSCIVEDLASEQVDGGDFVPAVDEVP